MDFEPEGLSYECPNGLISFDAEAARGIAGRYRVRRQVHGQHQGDKHRAVDRLVGELDTEQPLVERHIVLAGTDQPFLGEAPALLSAL